MRIELPWQWVAVLNVALWPLLQLGWAWAFIRMPGHWFRPSGPAAWECGGQIYQRWFRVKRWKDLLPDGASWFQGGVSKRAVDGGSAEALLRFATETWRGELCHWCVIACTPLFFLWNPWWGNLVMIAYALLANLPCVVAQRYNRARIMTMKALLRTGDRGTRRRKEW